MRTRGAARWRPCWKDPDGAGVCPQGRTVSATGPGGEGLTKGRGLPGGWKRLSPGHGLVCGSNAKVVRREGAGRRGAGFLETTVCRDASGRSGRLNDATFGPGPLVPFAVTQSLTAQGSHFPSALLGAATRTREALRALVRRRS